MNIELHTVKFCQKIRKYFLHILFCFLFISGEISAGDSSNVKTERLYLIGSVSVAGLGLSYGLQNNVWWKGDKSSFHFNWQYDWDADLGADKFGHFYFSHLITNIYAQAFSWAGIDKSSTLLYAGGVAFLHQSFTELRDGFSKEYGFSWGDYAFNIMGAAYPYFQSEVPILKFFNFKISYEESQTFKNGSHASIIDDYESTYNWLTIDINKLLPKEIESVIPDFINIAIGHSVTNLALNPQHQLFIGLDWNLEKLPGDGWFWKLIKKNFNYYHLPAPTIKIYPNVVWYGLKL